MSRQKRSLRSYYDLYSVSFTVHLHRIQGGQSQGGDLAHHPNAVSPTLSFVLRNDINGFYTPSWAGQSLMKIHHQYIAVLVSVSDVDPSQNQLKVWNWTQHRNPILVRRTILSLTMKSQYLSEGSCGTCLGLHLPWRAIYSVGNDPGGTQ